MLDFHHLSSQAGAHSLPILCRRAALNEQPAVCPAHLAFGQSSGIDADAANHVLRTDGDEDLKRNNRQNQSDIGET